MPSTIYDTYEAALNKKFTWLRALVLTDLLYIDEEGIKVCPPPNSHHEYNNYKVKLAALKSASK